MDYEITKRGRSVPYSFVVKQIKQPKQGLLLKNFFRKQSFQRDYFKLWPFLSRQDLSIRSLISGPTFKAVPSKRMAGRMRSQGKNFFLPSWVPHRLLRKELQVFPSLPFHKTWPKVKAIKNWPILLYFDKWAKVQVK